MQRREASLASELFYPPIPPALTPISAAPNDTSGTATPSPWPLPFADQGPTTSTTSPLARKTDGPRRVVRIYLLLLVSNNRWLGAGGERSEAEVFLLPIPLRAAAISCS
jgi:hypothetical protein